MTAQARRPSLVWRFTRNAVVWLCAAQTAIVTASLSGRPLVAVGAGVVVFAGWAWALRDGVW